MSKDDETGKPIWDKEVKVTDEGQEKRKQAEQNGLCEIFGKCFIGILMGVFVLCISEGSHFFDKYTKYILTGILQIYIESLLPWGFFKKTVF